eukprot:gb/GECH01001560.1/.p1 GENE.gb/GECH01001560.1/~~gb/GECH01001560.1/.p1  ORF type:complete len:254 (+),score=62.95 gb/GECH01001560.1/:1-762(+)
METKEKKDDNKELSLDMKEEVLTVVAKNMFLYDADGLTLNRLSRVSSGLRQRLHDNMFFHIIIKGGNLVSPKKLQNQISDENEDKDKDEDSSDDDPDIPHDTPMPRPHPSTGENVYASMCRSKKAYGQFIDNFYYCKSYRSTEKPIAPIPEIMKRNTKKVTVTEPRFLPWLKELPHVKDVKLCSVAPYLITDADIKNLLNVVDPDKLETLDLSHAVCIRQEETVDDLKKCPRLRCLWIFPKLKTIRDYMFPSK